MSDVEVRAATRADADTCARLALEPPGGLNLVIASRAARLRVTRQVFLSRATAFGFERTLVADLQGEVAGMVARFSDAEWPALRVRTGVVMVAAAGPLHWPAIVRRGVVEERAMPPIAPSRLYVIALAVDEGHRGRGIGTALLRRVVDEASARGLRAVALDVASDNEAAIRLYRREGFAKISEARIAPTRGLPELASMRMERILRPA